MAQQLFCVDLSSSAEDFEGTATEPGLAMLDASGVNYATLNKWLGDYAAEPVWQGPDKVAFYARYEGERILEHQASPVTAKDLEKPLKEQWEELQGKLRKGRPETNSEQLLQRVATKKIRNLAADPEANDVTCQLFKIRANGRPWQLVWCWGYQRTDATPGRGLVCRNKQCQQLFVHRQGQRSICPGCKKVTLPAKAGPLARIGGMRTVTALLALAVLLLLMLLFADGSISVEPREWKGPYGSEVALKVNNTRWFLFTSDVTDDVVVLSSDPRVMEAEANVARAKGVGKTTLTVRYGSSIADVPVDVTPAKPTVAIAIDPDAAKLIPGSTRAIKVIGTTEDDHEIDVTERVTLSVGDSEVADLHDGVLEGIKAGKTTLVATFRESAFSEEVRSEIDVDVADAKLESLSVDLTPSTLKKSQYASIDVHGKADDGETYGFSQSSQLVLRVEPTGVGELDEPRLRGVQAGTGRLIATVGETQGAAEFTVTGEGLYADGALDVSPTALNMTVYEFFEVDLLTNTPDQVSAESSAPGVVEVLNNRNIVARSPGEATVSFRQGDVTRTLQVTVAGGEYESIWIDSARIVMKPGQRKLVQLHARTLDDRQVELAPTSVTWESQPLAEYVAFDRQTGYLTALAPTPRPQRLTARIGDHLLAETLVEVVGVGGLAVAGSGGSSTMLAVDGDFVPHPPVPYYDVNAGRYVGRGLIFRGDGLTISDGLAQDHVLVQSGLRPGMRIVGVNDVDFTGWSVDRVRDYLLEHPLSREDLIVARGADGVVSRMPLGEEGQLIEPVKIMSASYHADGGMIYAMIRLQVADRGEYRIIAPGGAADDAWTPLEPGVSPSLKTKPFAKPADRVFELTVERRVGDVVKQYKKELKLPDDSLIQ